jgi:hypothetical protein
MKDYLGGVLEKADTQPGSHYKRLIWFFRDWGERKIATKPAGVFSPYCNRQNFNVMTDTPETRE